MLFDAALGSKGVQVVLTPQKAGSHERDIAACSALPHLSEVQKPNTAMVLVVFTSFLALLPLSCSTS